MNRLWAASFAVAALTVSAPVVASPLTITYSAADLTDADVGQDLWQYDYRLSGAIHLNQGFTLFFNEGLYTLIEDPPPLVNADWDLLTTQPDLALGDEGIYDGLAIAANPSLADPFTVQFVWLGPGTPDAQPFELYDYDPRSDTITAFATGLTQATPVPEPSTFLLLATGLSFAWRKRRVR